MLALTNHERAPVSPRFLPSARPATRHYSLMVLSACSRQPGCRSKLRERIAGDVRAAIAEPAVATIVAGTGQIVSPGSPAEFAARDRRAADRLHGDCQILGSAAETMTPRKSSDLILEEAALFARPSRRMAARHGLACGRPSRRAHPSTSSGARSSGRGLTDDIDVIRTMETLC